MIVESAGGRIASCFFESLIEGSPPPFLLRYALQTLSNPSSIWGSGSFEIGDWEGMRWKMEVMASRGRVSPLTQDTFVEDTILSTNAPFTNLPVIYST